MPQLMIKWTSHMGMEILKGPLKICNVERPQPHTHHGTPPPCSKPQTSASTVSPLSQKCNPEMILNKTSTIQKESLVPPRSQTSSVVDLNIF